MISFIAANWVWIVLIGAFVALHRRGGCGGHRAKRHDTADRDSAARRDPAEEHRSGLDQRSTR